MSKILVTGATGFVGANLVRELLKNTQNQIQVLARPTSNLDNLKGLPVKIIIGDLKDKSSLKAAVDAAEFVYHCAAEYSFWNLEPQRMFESNVLGTKNLLEICREEKVSKIIYTSTVGTIGLASSPAPCNEETQILPEQVTSLYKRTKIDAENIVLDFAKQGLPVTIVNPSGPIGPWDQKPTPTGQIIVDFLNQKMPAYLETGLNLVSVNDVAKGHILAANYGKIGERYILGGENLRLEEIFGLLSEITGLPKPSFKIPYAVAYVAGWISTGYATWVTKKHPGIPIEAVKMAKRHMFFDHKKAYTELGYRPGSVKEALIEAVAWYLKHGYYQGSNKQLMEKYI